MDTLRVYHGFMGDEFADGPYFFSEDRSHASDYGNTIHEYEISIGKLFDSCEIGDVNRLISVVGPIVDPYDDREYKTARGFIRSHGCCDTWEPIEQHLFTIKTMGYDGVRIYEGGCVNYIVFSDDQIKRI